MGVYGSPSAMTHAVVDDPVAGSPDVLTKRLGRRVIDRIIEGWPCRLQAPDVLIGAVECR